MTKRKRYSDEFRAGAVLMLEAAGYPDREGALAHVSSRLGVPHQTLGRWARAEQNPPPSILVHKKRIDLLEAIQDELAEIFPALADRRIDANYRELVTAAGILIDKKQLLSGKPTGTVMLLDESVRDLSDDHLRRNIAALSRAASILAGSSGDESQFDADGIPAADSAE